MKKLLKFSLFLFFVFFNYYSAAAERYQIELVVFAQDMPNTELLDQTQSEIHWPANVVDVSAFPSVDAAGRALSGAYRALSGSSSYRPLLHAAWIQSVDAGYAGDAVRIQDANGFINGFVRLQRAQYLYLNVDLEYQPDSGRYFRLHEKRRLKLNEDQYLDHPKFGVIAKVTPL